MLTWKMPPKAKIYEALSAVGDGRVVIEEPCKAKVYSSDKSKYYIVEWSQSIDRFSSNDNASFYQGYIGYPIIAVLMTIGAIPYNTSTSKSLSGINWNKLNKSFKRDYDRAVDAALEDVVNHDDIRQEAEAIYESLSNLKLGFLSRRTLPPK